MRKLKLIFFCLLILVGKTVKGQTFSCDTISWNSDLKLKWSDFKAVPNNNVTFAAMSVPSLGYKARMVGDTLKVSFMCYFFPCQSWTKFPLNTTLLQHEQTHFDIHEYLKREFVKKILSTKFKTASAFNQIEVAYQEISTMRNTLSIEYDKETNRSLNPEEQEKWTENMETKIEALKVYDKNQVTVIIRP